MTRAALLLALLPSLALAADPPAGKRYALLVGCNTYKNRNLPDLEYAEADITALADELKAGGYDLTVLLGSAEGEQRATRANIEAALADLLKKLDKHDTLLVALTGHGVQFAKDGGAEDAYYCPAEAVVGDPNTLVSLSAVIRQLGQKGAGTNLLLVDACRNNPDPNRSGIDGNTIRELPEGTAVLFSCARGQRAYESKALQHGVFFHYVLEALRGEARNADGEVTWDRLVVHVKERVEKDLPMLLTGPGAQTPHGLSNLARSPRLLAGSHKWDEVLARGLALQTGNGVEKDAPAAFKLIRQAADAGYAPAQVEAGDALFYGTGVTADEAEALAWYRKAAARGYARAEYCVGWMYEYGKGGVAADGPEATKWYRKAAERGYDKAQRAYGNCCYYGIGVEKNEAEATVWYRKAADQGLATAQNDLGWMYEYGPNKDDAQAVVWYRKAAEQNEVFGLYNLGRYYREGRGGLEKDPEAAAKLVRQSAEKGHAPAQNLFGNMNYYGEGVPKDAVESVKWYRAAADQGFAEGQYNLGWMYEHGEGGVGPDPAEALKWYRKAADQGNADAKKAVERLGGI